MAYVRINMVEFDSEEDLKRDAEVLNSNAGNLFPELLLIAGCRLLKHLRYPSLFTQTKKLQTELNLCVMTIWQKLKGFP